MPALKSEMAQKKRKKVSKKYFLPHIQIPVKCFDLVPLCPGDVMDYLRQFLIFRPRNFDGQSRVRYPRAIAHHLDENQKPNQTHDSSTNAPISALTTPYFAARSWASVSWALGGLLDFDGGAAAPSRGGGGGSKKIETRIPNLTEARPEIPPPPPPPPTTSRYARWQPPYSHVTPFACGGGGWVGGAWCSVGEEKTERRKRNVVLTASEPPKKKTIRNF
jgi:hypothetical protein